MNELKHAKYMEKAPDGKLSTKGMGSLGPNSAENLVSKHGYVIPAGQTINLNQQQNQQYQFQEAYSLSYNEYIVYNVNQVKMRYLIQVKER